jgi:hypothetical protein
MPRTMIGQQIHALRISKYYEDFYVGRVSILVYVSIYQHQSAVFEVAFSCTVHGTAIAVPGIRDCNRCFKF